MTIQQYASFDVEAAGLNATSKTNPAVAKMVAAWENKNAKRAMQGSGLALMAMSLTACGGSSSTTAVAPVTPVTPVTPVAPVVPTVDAAKSLAMTSTMDNLVGGSGNDTFSGVVQAAGAAGTTAFPGDVVDGGAGTDSLTISVAGDAGGAYTIAALDINNVETVQIANFDVNAGDTTIDTVLMDGVTTLGLTSSSATGDTIFTNVAGVKNASMANGSADLTLTYTAAAIVGTADTQNLAVSNVAAGTFTADGTENLVITSSLAKSTVAAVASDALKKVTISGDQDLKITAALDFASNGTASSGAVAAVAGAVVDASALTGKLTMTTTASEIFNIKGGAGADTFNLASLTKDDVLDAGAGDDTALITVHDAAAGALKMSTMQLSNLENFSVEATNTKATSINADGTTVSNIILVENNTNAKAAAVSNLSATQTVTINSNVDNQGVGVATLSLKDPAGAADSLTVNVNGTSGQGTEVVAGITTAAIETINLVSGSFGATAMLATDANVLTNMTVGTGTNLNISGAANITFSNAISGTTLKTVDASALTGKLSIVAAANDLNLTSGSGNDTLTMGITLTAADTIDSGAGATDALTAEMNGVGTADAYSALSIANVETVSLQTVTAASFLDMSGVTGMTTLNIGDKNSSAAVATTLSNLAADTKIGLGGLATDKEYKGTLTVGLADETGSADNITFVLADTDTDNDVTATLKIGTGTTTITTGVESITVQADTVGTANNATLDLTSMGAATVNVTKGSAAEVVALGTVNKNTTKIDASAFDGLLSVTGSASATTLDLKVGSGSNTITLGGANDVMTVATLGAEDANAGAGTDTLTATVKAGATEATTNFENITYSIGNNVQATMAGANGKGIDTATTFTLTGGDALSTYAHDLVSPAVLTKYDMSGFAGASTAVTVAATAANLSAVDITGSASAKDSVIVTTNNSNFQVKSMTGVETLTLNAVGGATAFDLSKTSGVTLVKTDDDGTARDVTLTDLADGTSVEIEVGITNSGVIVDMANKANAGNTLSLKVKTVAAAANVIDIDVDEVEQTTIYMDTAASLDLAGLSMTTGTSTLKLTGDSAGTISALHADVTTVDASGMIAGGSVVQTGRSTTDAVNYTGSNGNDTFIMMNKSDVIDGGEATGDNDTLDINFASVLGGINVDLSLTGDQVTTMNGMGEATVQKNFESVDLAGYTGAGAQVTGSIGANTIVGTVVVDQIGGGAGADTISSGGGADSLTGGTGSDNYNYANAEIGTGAAGQALIATDTITDFNVAAAASDGDKITIDISAVEAITGVTQLTDLGGTAITTGVVALTDVSAGVNVSALGTEVLTLAGAGITETQVEAALEASGSRVLVTDLAIGDAIIVASDNGTDTVLFIVSHTRETGDDNDFEAGNLDAMAFATLSGVAASEDLVADSFSIIA